MRGFCCTPPHKALFIVIVFFTFFLLMLFFFTLSFNIRFVFFIGLSHSYYTDCGLTWLTHFFPFFLLTFSSHFHHLILSWLRIRLHDLFYLLSIGLFRPHDSIMVINGLTQVNLSRFLYLFFIDFFSISSFNIR